MVSRRKRRYVGAGRLRYRSQHEQQQLAAATQRRNRPSRTRACWTAFDRKAVIDPAPANRPVLPPFRSLRKADQTSQSGGKRNSLGGHSVGAQSTQRAKKGASHLIAPSRQAGQ